jgi:hypothetical protein
MDILTKSVRLTQKKTSFVSKEVFVSEYYLNSRWQMRLCCGFYRQVLPAGDGAVITDNDKGNKRH